MTFGVYDYPELADPDERHPDEVEDEDDLRPWWDLDQPEGEDEDDDEEDDDEEDDDEEDDEDLT